jgi:hypothetical protein
MEYLNMDGRIELKLKINPFLDILIKMNQCFMGTYCFSLPEGGGRRFLKKFGNVLQDVTSQKPKTLMSVNIDHKNLNSSVILQFVYSLYRCKLN